MSTGLVFNHLSASGNRTQTINSVAQGAVYVSGAAGFGVPDTVGGAVNFPWPGSDTTFFVSGAVATNASATSFGTLGNYDIAVFGGNLQVSGALSVQGSIRGGLEAKRSDGTAATPVAQQIAFWTSNLFLSGNQKLRWDDSDLVLGGNLQIQGSTTTISSSNYSQKDSILGLGFSGSNTYNNAGQRSILFGKGSAAGLIRGLTWDGTRAYTVGVPALPTSGSVTISYKGPGLSGLIPIPSYESGEVTSAALVESTYGGGSVAKKMVFPVAQAGTVYYPAISGTADFQNDAGTYLPALHTEKFSCRDGKSVFGNLPNDAAYLAVGASPFSAAQESAGQWKFYSGGGTTNSGVLSSFPGSLKLRAQSGIHLSASNGHVEIKHQSTGSLRTNYDNQAPLGQAAVAWSDLFLASGAVIGLNSDQAANGVKITHDNSATSLILSGTMEREAGSFTSGAKANFDSDPEDGGGTFLAGSQTLTQASTSIGFSSGFSATDVTQMAAGNLIILEESGVHYYYQIQTQPSAGGTSLSVVALGSGQSNQMTFSAGNFSFAVDTYYAPQFATSFTPPAEYNLGASDAAWRNLYVDDLDLNGAITTGSFVLDTDGDTAIGTSADDVIDWFIGNVSTSKFFMNASGLFPKADNSYDLGKPAKRYRNIFTGDVNLQNDRGDWTLIEENDFISFRNNMTGRRFRMVMEDITGMGNYGPGNDGEM